MYEYGEGHGAEVLVIDDEPSVGIALKIILEDSGYCVAVALNGRDGIEQARRKQFCLTITDMCLPDMTGFDIINTLCGDRPPDKFILITSHNSDDVLSPARDCGVKVLFKPFTPPDILQLAASLVGSYRATTGDEDPPHRISHGDAAPPPALFHGETNTPKCDVR